MSALIAALQRLNPACGATAQTVLAGLTNPAAEIRRVMGVLINDILETLPYLFDLLAEEIFRQQEPAVQTFLLETSILSELTPALCRAVTGRSEAEAILADLYRRNLFLIAVETEDEDADQQAAPSFPPASAPVLSVAEGLPHPLLLPIAITTFLPISSASNWREKGRNVSLNCIAGPP